MEVTLPASGRLKISTSATSNLIEAKKFDIHNHTTQLRMLQRIEAQQHFIVITFNKYDMLASLLGSSHHFML